MSKKYNNPPIVEALCEFQFITDQQWDLTIPGLIYAEIKEKFPQKQQQVGIGIQFKPTDNGGVENRVENAPPRMRFFNQDKTMLVQVGPDLLVVNQLKPYKSWNSFKPIILENLNIYRKEAGPRGFKRIGLRYINKINIKSTLVTLKNIKNYLKFHPSVPMDIPQDHLNFILRTEIPCNNGRDLIVLIIGSATPEETGISSIILDLNYVLSQSDSIPIDNVESWLEEAHSSIENFFEACITDKSRKIFEEVEI